MFVLNAESKQVVGLRRIKNDSSNFIMAADDCNFRSQTDIWPGDTVTMTNGTVWVAVSTGFAGYYNDGIGWKRIK